LALHEIWLATRENGAVGDEKILGNARIRDHNKELISHPDRKQGPIGRCPRSQRALRIAAKESVAQPWTWRDRVPVFIDYVSSNEEWKGERKSYDYEDNE
jgi:hypothetical protein